MKKILPLMTVVLALQACSGNERAPSTVYTQAKETPAPVKAYSSKEECKEKTGKDCTTSTSSGGHSSFIPIIIPGSGGYTSGPPAPSSSFSQGYKPSVSPSPAPPPTATSGTKSGGFGATGRGSGVGG